MKISTALRHADDYVASMPAIHVNNVPQELHEELLRIAQQENCTLGDVVLQAIKHELELRAHMNWVDRVIENAPNTKMSAEEWQEFVDELRAERDAR